MALLEVEDLRTHFHTREGIVRAVDGVSFSLDAGKTLGIVGESGCGKSVTALSIMGLLPKPAARIESGHIRFENTDLATLPERRLQDLRGKEIGMIFQDPMTTLNPTLKISTQITQVLRRHLGLSRGDARRRAIELLEEVRIPDAAERIDEFPHRLSGGMRQRVMIAIAIACNPKLVIADEPTTALDVTIQAEILDLLDDLRRDHDMALMMITHDMGVVAETADEVVVMYAGQIVERASVYDLFASPEHPYTEGLLGAVPELDDPEVRGRRLAAIPGAPPPLINPPAVCRFAARCRHAALGDSCTTAAPPLREIRPGHLVRTAHPRSERQPLAAGARG